jgi:hypothetical protein
MNNTRGAKKIERRVGFGFEEKKPSIPKFENRSLGFSSTFEAVCGQLANQIIR